MERNYIYQFCLFSFLYYYTFILIYSNTLSLFHTLFIFFLMQSLSSSSSCSASSLHSTSHKKASPILIRANKFPNKNGQLSYAESVFISTTNTSNQYGLGQIPSDPFHMSPPNLFMEKLQKRIDKYYSNDNGGNCFSLTTSA